jgi:peptidoglycan/LPS O-acetylase OafA/YrhL
LETTARPRVATVDSLRAVAIVLVLLRHSTLEFPSLGGPLFRFMKNGWMGVDLFFVLSGFLIIDAWTRMARTSRDGQSGHPARRYLLKRALRIVPCYYFVLALTVLGVFPLYVFRQDHLAYRAFYHLLFLQDYLPADICVPFWSLGDEEKFYLLAPAFAFGLSRLASLEKQLGAIGILILCVAGVRFVTVSLHPETAEYAHFFPIARSPFHLCIDAFAVGVACSLLHGSTRARAFLAKGTRSRWLLGLGVAAFLVLTETEAWMDEPGIFRASLLFPCIALSFGAMLWALTSPEWQTTWFARSKTLQALARWSYPLYLTHFLFLRLAHRITLTLSPSPQILVQYVEFAFVWLTISFTAAILLHRGVERPFLQLKDRI